MAWNLLGHRRTWHLKNTQMRQFYGAEFLMAKTPRVKEVSKCSLLLEFRGYAPLKPLGWSGISARNNKARAIRGWWCGKTHFSRTELHGASTFLRSALSLWSEAGGCLLLLGQGGWAGQGREGRQVPSDKVEPGWRDSMDKTEQCVLLFQTSSEFR